MKLYFFGIIGAIIAIYAGTNYYIGLRGWQYIGSRLHFLSAYMYWIIIGMVAISYLIARLAQKFLPSFMINIFNIIGAYWMAAMLYFFMILVIIDLIRLINKYTEFLPKGFSQSAATPLITGIAVIAIVVGVLAYGTLNAKNIKVANYDIAVHKKAGNFKEMNVVMISDLHLGNVVGRDRLEVMVDKINKLNPDIVLIPGDIIDDDIKPFVKQDMMASFRKVKSKLGVYASLGNHEYFGGSMEEKLENFKLAGINILKDSSIKLENSFYLIGREDKTAEQMGAFKRKKLVDLTRDLDENLPIILLDHTPDRLNEAEQQGIDLQLSGHTHHGQFFPANLVTERIFEIDWGYLKKGSLNVVVSNGLGTWGPPIRIGNSPEIVNIKLRFLV